jgi:DNA-binding MarR family transcriptional regulator
METKLLRFIGTLDESFRSIREGLGKKVGFEKLTVSQLQYLDAIGMQGVCTASELALRLGYSKASVSVAIAGLEAAGYVIKAKLAEDARLSILSLSKQGEKVFSAKQKALKQYGAFIRKSLTVAEAASFEAILDKLNRQFEQRAER